MGQIPWPEMHGAVTHFPVALLITSAAYDVGAIVLRKPAWRAASLWMLLAAAILALPALLSGAMTGEAMFGSSGPAPAVYTSHRAAAFATTVLAILLLAWRGATRDNLEKGALGVSVILSVLVAGSVGYTGFLGGKMVFQGIEPLSGVKTQAPKAGDMLTKLEGVGCLRCHSMDGQGGEGAPDLSHEGARHSNVSWQVKHLKDPDSLSPGSSMPSYARLPRSELKQIATYLAVKR